MADIQKLFVPAIKNAEAQILAKKTAAEVTRKAAKPVLKQMAMNITDASAISASAIAAKATAPDAASQVASLIASKPASWGDAGSQGFHNYVTQCLNLIKSLRGEVPPLQSALDSANQAMSAADATFSVPVKNAQAALNGVDNQLRPIANQAQSRLAAAKAGMRSTMRPGADQAQNLLSQASSSIDQVRGNMAPFIGTDMNASLAPVVNANAAIGQALPRISQNSSSMATIASAMAGSGDPAAAQLGGSIVNTANAITTNANTMEGAVAQVNDSLQHLSAVDTQVAGQISTTDAALVNAKQALDNANAALAVAPDENTVLAHAKALDAAKVNAGSSDYLAARQSLVNDYAGQNPAAVMPNLSSAQGNLQSAATAASQVNPGLASMNDLSTLDAEAQQVTGVAAQMDQGAGQVAPAIGNLQSADANAMAQAQQMSPYANAVTTDVNTVVEAGQGLSSAPIRDFQNSVTATAQTTAQSAANLQTYVTSAEQNLAATPSDAQIQQAAHEWVDADASNTAAWNNLSSAEAGPQATLTQAQSTYAANMQPSRQAVASADSNLQAVTNPIAQLVNHTQGLPDDVPLLVKTKWALPGWMGGNSFHAGDDFNTQVNAILGPNGLS